MSETKTSLFMIYEEADYERPRLRHVSASLEDAVAETERIIAKHDGYFTDRFVVREVWPGPVDRFSDDPGKNNRAVRRWERVPCHHTESGHTFQLD